MFKIKFVISISLFFLFIVLTSVVKNETRELEKEIYIINNNVVSKERNLNETQLEFSYLTSPNIIEKKIDNLFVNKYISMDFSNIFLNFSSFENLKNKLATQEKKYEKKIQKN